MSKTRLVKNLRTHRALLVEVLAEDFVHFADWVRLEARMSVLLSWEV